MIPTCAVTCTVHDQSGNPDVGARVRARLNRYEVYNGYVVPEFVTGVTDENGECVLHLWPNQLGSTESLYDITILGTAGRRLTTTAVVPNQSTANLHQIAELPPYDGKTEGQLILDDAVAAGAEAVAAKNAAETAEAGAVTAKAAAETAQTGAETAETNAVAARSGAETAETGAVAAKNAAETAEAGAETAKDASQAAKVLSEDAKAASIAARDTAQAWADRAEDVEVEPGKYSAFHHAAKSASSATAAATSASSADSAETAALLSASAAATSESNAAASESAAATSESNAAASESAAATSATDAEARKNAAETAETNAANSETAAANSASAAQTAETNAETAETGAVTAKNAAEAAQTASEAARDAAATSETNAATSEGNAATSASEAQDAEAGALAIYGSTAAVDAAVSDAETARDQSQSARDTAEQHKDSAAASATQAANTASSISGFDLDAIAESKAVTAVDVFVYDTSKDSDGGAWRNSTQDTSWYNETLNTATRGGRREFPAVAVIVAEADNVTIYDGDDPALPMWMVFIEQDTFGLQNLHAGKASNIVALNGELWLSNYTFLNFIRDNGRGVRASSGSSQINGPYNGDISQRNDGLSFSFDGTILIANDTVNDVAMTVLPDAPIDPATGLPVPTIAVATDGGVSVIKDDGTVVDSSDTALQILVQFDNEGIWYGRTGALFFAAYNDLSSDGFGDRVANKISDADEFGLLTLFENLSTFGSNFALGGTNPVDDSVAGLMLHQPNYTDQSKGMSALLTSTYNTGWMPGDIKGAFLSDTDDTDLVGSGELVTNGTFDTDVSGWTAIDDGSTITFSSGSAVVESNGNYGAAFQEITLVVGRKYVVTGSVTPGSSGGRIRFGSPVNASSWMNLVPGAGNFSFTITPTKTTGFLTLGTNSASGTCTFDNISVKLADHDRSVNNNGLIVNGTVTREPVAPGADLVAYSGFSSSNYLEQPYNPDLDFGTGDFCVMGWVKVDGTDTTRAFAGRGADSGETFRFTKLSASAGNVLRVRVSSSDSTSSSSLGDFYSLVCIVRRGDSLELFFNGELEDTAQTLNNVSATTNQNPFWFGSDGSITPAAGLGLALWRISATAPSAEQIKRIYEDEKVLFQENAACTLYGTSDAVTALAHDPVTDLLHVGTSDGRSVFQGLRRVDNTTDAVSKAISASNGLVVEE